MNIEEKFYNEDGSFIPLTGVEGNISEKLSHLRATYMEAEREYFLELLSDEHILTIFFELLEYNSEDLFKVGMKIQEKIEYGELETEEEKNMMKIMSPEEREKYHLMLLEQAEALMCLLFAAARDKVLIKTLIPHFKAKKRMDFSELNKIIKKEYNESNIKYIKDENVEKEIPIITKVYGTPLEIEPEEEKGKGIIL